MIDLKENTASRKKEESGTFDTSMLKMKRKLDESEAGTTIETGSVDKSKHKKLEMPTSRGVNPESWVYQAEHL